MIVLLCAVRRESAPIRRLLGGRTMRLHAFAAWESPGVILAECGVGPEAATRAISTLLTLRPARVIMVGFAGALRDRYPVGTVLTASELIDVAGVVHSCDCAGERFLSWPVLVGNPSQKRELAQRTQAVAVEMEGGSVAIQCRAAGVPFEMIRAISDGVDDALSPELIELLDSGRVRAGRLVLAILRRPKLIAELLRLERATRRAGNALAVAVIAYLQGQSAPKQSR